MVLMKKKCLGLLMLKKYFRKPLNISKLTKFTKYFYVKSKNPFKNQDISNSISHPIKPMKCRSLYL